MKKVSSYIPPFELTEGQPAPFAANGGLSYMSFDQDGDAGTAAATPSTEGSITPSGQWVNDTAAVSYTHLTLPTTPYV